jgi:hypothetical protein
MSTSLDQEDQDVRSMVRDLPQDEDFAGLDWEALMGEKKAEYLRQKRLRALVPRLMKEIVATGTAAQLAHFVRSNELMPFEGTYGLKDGYQPEATNWARQEPSHWGYKFNEVVQALRNRREGLHQMDGIISILSKMNWDLRQALYGAETLPVETFRALVKSGELNSDILNVTGRWIYRVPAGRPDPKIGLRDYTPVTLVQYLIIHKRMDLVRELHSQGKWPQDMSIPIGGGKRMSTPQLAAFFGLGDEFAALGVECAQPSNTAPARTMGARPKRGIRAQRGDDRDDSKDADVEDQPASKKAKTA